MSGMWVEADQAGELEGECLWGWQEAWGPSEPSPKAMAGTRLQACPHPGPSQAWPRLSCPPHHDPGRAPPQLHQDCRAGPLDHCPPQWFQGFGGRPGTPANL